MKGSALAASSLLGAVVRAAEGVVQWDIAKRQPGPRLARRAGSTVQEAIGNEVSVGGYFATVKIGTPAQSLMIQLDTGSSDVWVPSNQAQICTETSQVNAGCTFGSFNFSGSSTFAVVGQNDFSISYVDGSQSKGDYFTDVFQIGGVSLSNLTMGLGLDTDIPHGLAGIGYESNEAIVGTTQSLSSEYPNLPAAMVSEGLIKTNAYSLWLNDLDASSGSILFGGIDTDKYKGDLARIDIYKASGSDAFTAFIVAMTSLQAVSSTGTDSLTSTQFPIPAVLDSGTTLSYLPDDLAAQVWNEAGAVYSADIGVAAVPCSMADSKGYFSFGLGGTGGPLINITMGELVLDASSGQAPTFTSGRYKGQTACEFGIQNLTSGPYLLGDTFLRSAYVVYDLVNNQIAIAPTDFNSTTSNVVAFASSGAPIPSATVAPNQDEISAAASTTSTSSLSASSGFTGSSGTKSAASAPAALDWSKMAIVGAAMGFTILGSGLFLL